MMDSREKKETFSKRFTSCWRNFGSSAWINSSISFSFLSFLVLFFLKKASLCDIVDPRLHWICLTVRLDGRSHDNHKKLSCSPLFTFVSSRAVTICQNSQQEHSYFPSNLMVY